MAQYKKDFSNNDYKYETMHSYYENYNPFLSI